MTKNAKSFSWEKFSNIPIVAILRDIRREDLPAILSLCQETGLDTVEITLNTRYAEEMIHYAIRHHGSDLNIGAGTVCNQDELSRALKAGAEFIVTPVLDEEVVTFCTERKIPVFPGAYSPSEIYRAWSLGADMVKIFPATALGPEYVRDVKGPLNQIKLMPTGGITIENCSNFLNAGASAVAMGGQLFDKRLIATQNWKALKGHFENLVTKIKTRTIL